MKAYNYGVFLIPEPEGGFTVTEKTKQAELNVLRATIDPRLDELFEGKILFPEKLAQANEFVVKHPLPDHLKKRPVK